jgi:cell shape-determining protein MreC
LFIDFVSKNSTLPIDFVIKKLTSLIDFVGKNSTSPIDFVIKKLTSLIDFVSKKSTSLDREVDEEQEMI